MDANHAREARRWSSLVVPSVKEMVKEKNITTVPPRYVRPDQDKAEIAHDSGVKPEIPVINMKLLLSATAMDSELQKLDFACKEWGFFQESLLSFFFFSSFITRFIWKCLIQTQRKSIISFRFSCGFTLQLVNHGVDSCLLDKVKVGIQDLFNLPIEEKKKLWQKTGDIEGFGQAFVQSEDQKLDWGDMFYLTTQPVRLRRPHLSPKLPLPFRDALDTFSTEVKNIAKILTAKMARALEIKLEEMEDLFDDLWQSMRMNYYPPCPQPDQVIGLTPHSDPTGLTLLLQVNEVEGLQIKKDGKWVTVKPLPNAFVVNVGDMIEIITNGVYRSVEHRAIVNEKKERLSVAVFHGSGFDTEIGPARSLVERQDKALFRSMSTEEYYNAFFGRELKGKSQLQLMRI